MLRSFDDKLKLVMGILASIGLLIFVIGIIISIKVIFLDIKNKEVTYGTITSMYDGTTVVEYKAGDGVYTKRFSAYSSTYYVGKTVKLYYKVGNEKSASLAGMRYLVLIVPGIGLIMTGMCGIVLIIDYIKNRKEEYAD